VPLTRDRSLILGAAFIGCLGVFGMHVLLPALPAIGERFAASAAETQLLISGAMLAIGIVTSNALALLTYQRIRRHRDRRIATSRAMTLSQETLT
jgi:nitrate reductase gamma subunit